MGVMMNSLTDREKHDVGRLAGMNHAIAKRTLHIISVLLVLLSVGLVATGLNQPRERVVPVAIMVMWIGSMIVFAYRTVYLASLIKKLNADNQTANH
jgi:hypothetical protein